MYDKAALVIDGSFGSEVAARYGLVIAKAFGSRATVLSAYESEEEESKISSSCDRVLLQGADLGLDIEVSLRKGDLSTAVEEGLEELDPDIVLADLRNPENLSFGLARKSVPISLIRDFWGSVILARVVNCGIPLNHERMLVPIKGSRKEESDRELSELLYGLSRYYEAGLTLYSCVEISGKKVYDSSEISELKYRRRKQVTSMSERIMEKGLRPNLTIETCSTPHKSILDRVSKERHDLMVLEFTRQNILKVLIKGHDLTKLISGAPCNVLIWRPGQS